MVEPEWIWGTFTAMRIAGVARCAAALLLVGCGGGDDRPEISTTKFNQSTAAAPTNAAPSTAVAPTDLGILKFVRRTNVTTVVTSEATFVATNVVLVYFKNKEDFQNKKGYTGPTATQTADGTQFHILLQDGVRHGMCQINYRSGKTKYRVNYEKGLKNGWSLGWYETGKRRSRAYYTNNFRAGPWFTYHPNGMTNTVVVYSPKKLGTVLRRAAFDPLGKPLVGRTYSWEIGGTNPAKQITGYRGKQPQVLIGVFGDPDQKTGSLWIYRGLRIRDMQARMIRRTVRFTVENNAVTAVEVLP